MPNKTKAVENTTTKLLANKFVKRTSHGLILTEQGAKFFYDSIEELYYLHNNHYHLGHGNTPIFQP